MQTGSEQLWQSLQLDLGLQVPRDLYDLGMTYGSGKFCKNAIEVFNPFSDKYRLIIESECDRFKMASGFNIPYKIFPDLPGLFPWGRDVNGHTMLWMAQASATTVWPIVLATEDFEFEHWDNLEMTRLLAQVFSGKIKCILWPRPFTDDTLIFVPRPHVV